MRLTNISQSLHSGICYANATFVKGTQIYNQHFTTLSIAAATVLAISTLVSATLYVLGKENTSDPAAFEVKYAAKKGFIEVEGPSVKTPLSKLEKGKKTQITGAVPEYDGTLTVKTNHRQLAKMTGIALSLAVVTHLFWRCMEYGGVQSEKFLDCALFDPPSSLKI